MSIDPEDAIISQRDGRATWVLLPYMVKRASCPDPSYVKNHALALGVIAALCNLSPYVLSSWDGYSHRCPSTYDGRRCDRWRGHSYRHVNLDSPWFEWQDGVRL